MGGEIRVQQVQLKDAYLGPMSWGPQDVFILPDGGNPPAGLGGAWCSYGLASESLASANYPVGTVAISGDGAGDQTILHPGFRRPRWLDASLISSDRRANEATGRSASELSGKSLIYSDHGLRKLLDL
jgi:hypothetical protein